MSTNLMNAHHEWASRPADERFPTLRALYLRSLALTEASSETTEDLHRATVEVGADGNLLLNLPHSGLLKMSNWAFGQFCNTIGSSAKYMRTLSNEPMRAAHNLNRDITKNHPGRNVVYVQGTSGTPKIVSVTSTSYGRCPNHVVAEELMNLEGNWRTLPARPAMADQPGTRIATVEDESRSSLVKAGDTVAPAGLYASSENMFAFMVDDTIRIEDGSDGGLSLGFFAVNSEVGQRAFELTTFMFRHACSNHIVWDAEGVESFHIKHVGDNIEERIRQAIRGGIKSFRNTNLLSAEERVNKAKQLQLGGNFDEISDMLFARKSQFNLTRRDIKAAYQLAEQYVHIDGNPRSAYGFANGLTRYSQTQVWADAQEKLDRSAARVIALADVSA